MWFLRMNTIIFVEADGEPIPLIGTAPNKCFQIENHSSGIVSYIHCQVPRRRYFGRWFNHKLHVAAIVSDEVHGHQKRPGT